MKKTGDNRVAGFFKSLYIKIFKINDSGQRVAAGFGLGVFSGIIPGIGPLAALFLAALFRVNAASALIGCLLTNTWLSIVTFLLSIKVGAIIMNVEWQDLQREWIVYFNNFKWQNLTQLAILKIIFPVIIGYLTIAGITGLLAYLLIITAIKIKDRAAKNLEKEN